ncbi:MAG: acyl carrier protein [Thermoleophilum sp.]|nr:acyl carrier protein [Thermoleophilum sp.]
MLDPLREPLDLGLHTGQGFGGNERRERIADAGEAALDCGERVVGSTSATIVVDTGDQRVDLRPKRLKRTAWLRSGEGALDLGKLVAQRGDQPTKPASPAQGLDLARELADALLEAGEVRRLEAAATRLEIASRAVLLPHGGQPLLEGTPFGDESIETLVEAPDGIGCATGVLPRTAGERVGDLGETPLERAKRRIAGDLGPPMGRARRIRRCGLRDILEQSDRPIHATLDEQTLLFGKGALLDSLSLVTLVVDLEQRLEEQFGLTLTLADDRAMSQRHSPFRSVGTLVDYLEQLISEESGRD